MKTLFFTIIISLFSGLCWFSSVEARGSAGMDDPAGVPFTGSVISSTYPGHKAFGNIHKVLQTNQDAVLEKRSEFEWDFDQEEWVENERIEYDYDARGRIEELVTRIEYGREVPHVRRWLEREDGVEIWTEEEWGFHEEKWVPLYLTHITFSDEYPGYPEMIEEKRWNREEGEWENEWRETITYTDGLLDESIDERWDGENWVKKARSQLKQEGDDVVSLYQSWIEEEEVWENVSKVTFLELTIREVFEFFLESEFYNDEDMPEFFIAADMPAAIQQEWAEDDWVNTEQWEVSEEYENGAIKSRALTVYGWEDEDWQFLNRVTLLYDEEGRPVESKLEFEWEPGQLLKVMEEKYEYGEEGLLSSSTTRALMEDFDLMALAEEELPFFNVKRLEYTWDTQPVGIVSDPEVPSGYSLGHAYPNPFNPQTVIPYTMPETSQVTITLHDLLGRSVAVLYDGKQVAGTHKAVIDGAGLASGRYIVRMSTGTFTATQSVTLVK